jgi:hypothetical protein
MGRGDVTIAHRGPRDVCGMVNGRIVRVIPGCGQGVGGVTWIADARLQLEARRRSGDAIAHLLMIS